MFQYFIEVQGRIQVGKGSCPTKDAEVAFIPLALLYLCRAQRRQQRIGVTLLELYDDHSLDLAMPDRVPDLGRRAAERTVGHIQ